jgi:tetratricopeptide (TPR) repeat protein
MTEGDMYERLMEIIDLERVGREEALRGAKQLYRVLRRANADEISPQGVHRAAQILAHTFMDAGRLKTAIRVAKWAMTVDCESKKEAYHHYLMGSCYLLMRGRENEAAREFTKALKFPEPELEDAVPGVYYKAAYAYKEIGEYARALECCRKVLGLIPNPSSYEERHPAQSALATMVDCFWAMGREAEAMDTVKSILNLEEPVPGARPLAYSRLAAIHEYHDEYEAAAENYRKAIELVEEDIERPWKSAHRDSKIAEMKSWSKGWRFDLRECEIRNRTASGPRKERK